jgi:hypothetical protein
MIAGPIQLVNAYPVEAPVIRKVTSVLKDDVLQIRAAAMAERSRHQARRSQQVEPQTTFSFDRKSYKQRHRIEITFC